MGFECYKDKDSGREFLYNKATGETRWTGATSKPSPHPKPPSTCKTDLSLVDTDEFEMMDLNKHEPTTLIPDDNDEDTNSSHSSSESATEENSLVKTPKSQSLLQSKSVVLGDTSTPSHLPNNHRETINTFRCCLTFHTFCCEAPMAVFEGYTKSLLLITLAMLLLILSAFSPNLKKHAKSHFRESILFFAASVTLMIPCSATCCVYGQFKALDDWESLPILTFVGCVDPRRFSVFEGGDGAIASNYYQRGAKSMDSW